jgi:hypothetical protein
MVNAPCILLRPRPIPAPIAHLVMQVHPQILQVRMRSVHAHNQRIIAGEALLFQPQPKLGVAFDIVESSLEEFLQLVASEIVRVHGGAQQGTVKFSLAAA